MKTGKTVVLGAVLMVGLLQLEARAAAASTDDSARVVYRDNLTSSRHWSEETISRTPDAEKIRGPFCSQTVTLALTDLPRHGWMKVRFDLFVRGTWDGSNKIWGPDLWSLTARGGPRLIFATICNMGHYANNNEQSFPDDYPAAVHPARTGAADHPVLHDYTVVGDRRQAEDVALGRYTVYPIEVVFPHISRSVNLDFEGIYDDPEPEQSWGVKNVVVEVATEAPTPDGEAFPRLWDDLASADATVANAALWKFVGAGDLAISFLTDRISEFETNAASPAPIGATTALNVLRLRRTDRIIRIIGGARMDPLRFPLEQYLLRY